MDTRTLSAVRTEGPQLFVEVVGQGRSTAYRNRYHTGTVDLNQRDSEKQSIKLFTLSCSADSKSIDIILILPSNHIGHVEIWNGISFVTRC